MSNSTAAAHVSTLFRSAKDDGTISPGSMSVLEDLDLGAQINAGLGLSIDEVTASEVVLLTMLIDDSGSIRFGSNAQFVREGHNVVIDELGKAKSAGDVLAHTRYLNGRVLYPFVMLDRSEKMTAQNYAPNGGTPLYDETGVILGTVLAKEQEFKQNGVPCRTVTLIVTDGHDEGSRKLRASDCKKIITDMLRTERHIVAAMGIDDGTTDFQAVFGEMGIPPQWILTPKNTGKEIRAAFQLFSQRSSQASASAASFSKTAVGGFAAP